MCTFISFAHGKQCCTSRLDGTSCPRNLLRSRMCSKLSQPITSVLSDVHSFQQVTLIHAEKRMRHESEINKKADSSCLFSYRHENHHLRYIRHRFFQLLLFQLLEQRYIMHEKFTSIAPGNTCLNNAASICFPFSKSHLNFIGGWRNATPALVVKNSTQTLYTSSMVTMTSPLVPDVSDSLFPTSRCWCHSGREPVLWLRKCEEMVPGRALAQN